MKSSEIHGVFKERNRLFTENPDLCKGLKTYNEKLVDYKGKQFRSWNPYRSKLAAAILKEIKINIKPDSKFLYLGAATGTTVSHISDIVKEGFVFSVENSPVAVKKLIENCEKRQNVIPIFEDANHPDRYGSIVPVVDFVYQDISQRNQADIFIQNISRYLRKKGEGILMVKARSIDVSLKPSKVYDFVCSQLESNELTIVNMTDLKPYEKDHAAIVISN